MRSQLHADQLTTWSADNAGLDGIADIGNLLAQGKLLSPLDARHSSLKSPNTNGTRKPLPKTATKS